MHNPACSFACCTISAGASVPSAPCCFPSDATQTLFLGAEGEEACRCLGRISCRAQSPGELRRAFRADQRLERAGRRRGGDPRAWCNSPEMLADKLAKVLPLQPPLTALLVTGDYQMPARRIGGVAPTAAAAAKAVAVCIVGRLPATARAQFAAEGHIVLAYAGIDWLLIVCTLLVLMITCFVIRRWIPALEASGTSGAAYRPPAADVGVRAASGTSGAAYRPPTLEASTQMDASTSGAAYRPSAAFDVATQAPTEASGSALHASETQTTTMTTTITTQTDGTNMPPPLLASAYIAPRASTDTHVCFHCLARTRTEFDVCQRCGLRVCDACQLAHSNAHVGIYMAHGSHAKAGISFPTHPPPETHHPQPKPPQPKPMPAYKPTQPTPPPPPPANTNQPAPAANDSSTKAIPNQTPPKLFPAPGPKTIPPAPATKPSPPMPPPAAPTGPRPPPPPGVAPHRWYNPVSPQTVQQAMAADGTTTSADERAAARRAMHTTGALCCGTVPANLSGTNQYWIRLKCYRCGALFCRLPVRRHL